MINILLERNVTCGQLYLGRGVETLKFCKLRITDDHQADRIRRRSQPFEYYNRCSPVASSYLTLSELNQF